VIAVVDLLDMRTFSTSEMAFVRCKPSKLSSGIIDKSLPEDVVPTGLIDQSRMKGMKFGTAHFVLRWHEAKHDEWEALGSG